jgi:hypothetical protein
MLADEQPGPDQIAVLKAMTPGERYLAGRRLYWTIRRHKEAFLRSENPEWSEERVKREVRDIFLRART